MSETKPGDVIAFEVVGEIRAAKSGEPFMGPKIEVLLGPTANEYPILRRIEGASVCLPVERTYLDARKTFISTQRDCDLEKCYEATVPLDAHYRERHAREQAAKRVKWEVRSSSSDIWVQRDLEGGAIKWDSRWPDTEQGRANAQARADALNALEAKP